MRGFSNLLTKYALILSLFYKMRENAKLFHEMRVLFMKFALNQLSFDETCRFFCVPLTKFVVISSYVLEKSRLFHHVLTNRCYFVIFVENCNCFTIIWQDSHLFHDLLTKWAIVLEFFLTKFAVFEIFQRNLWPFRDYWQDLCFFMIY